MSPTVTTSQAAERLDVPLSTLKAWLEKLDMPLPVDSRGRRLLDESTLNVLKTVRALREQDLGYETIRRRLADEGVPVSTPAQPEASGAIIKELKITLLDALTQQTDIAEAYAAATREIGRLEERVAVMQDQLAARDSELRRLAHELATLQGDDHQMIVESSVKPTWKFW